MREDLPAVNPAAGGPISAVNDSQRDAQSQFTVGSAVRSNSGAAASPSREAPSQPQFQPPVRPENIKIIPGLPDRNSGKTYRLQAGAYSSRDAANRIAELIRSAGFEAEIEQTGSIYRVLAAGISSPDVYSASIRLGSLGFDEIWVRE
jgi:cell division septation protein DedD